MLCWGPTWQFVLKMMGFCNFCDVLFFVELYDVALVSIGAHRYRSEVRLFIASKLLGDICKSGFDVGGCFCISIDVMVSSALSKWSLMERAGKSIFFGIN